MAGTFEPFPFPVTTHEGVATVMAPEMLDGDSINLEDIRLAFKTALNEKEVNKLVINCRFLTFIDRDGVGVLAGGVNQAEELNKEFSLKNVRVSVVKALGVTSILSRLVIDPPDQEA